ncbi:MAG: Neurogenic locus notch protein 3 [Marteilia pararefringens]
MEATKRNFVDDDVHDEESNDAAKRQKCDEDELEVRKEAIIERAKNKKIRVRIADGFDEAQSAEANRTIMDKTSKNERLLKQFEQDALGVMNRILGSSASPKQTIDLVIEKESLNSILPNGKSILTSLCCSSAANKFETLSNLVRAGADLTATDAYEGKNCLQHILISEIGCQNRKLTNSRGTNREALSEAHLSALNVPDKDCGEASIIDSTFSFVFELLQSAISGDELRSFLVESTDKSGENVLITAVKFFKFQEALVLLDYASNNNFLLDFITKRDKRGWNFMFHALDVGAFDLIQKILPTYENNINDCDEKGNSLLHLATLRNCATFIEQLIENGANIEAQNSHRRTPVFATIKEECDQAFKVLLKHNSNLLHSDSNNKTPLDFCLETKRQIYYSIVPELEEFRGKRNGPDTEAIVSNGYMRLQ